MKTRIYATSNSKVIPFRQQKAPAYPNAAEKTYYANKVLDYILSAVTGAGMLTALICIFTFL